MMLSERTSIEIKNNLGPITNFKLKIHHDIGSDGFKESSCFITNYKDINYSQEVITSNRTIKKIDHLFLYMTYNTSSYLFYFLSLDAKDSIQIDISLGVKFPIVTLNEKPSYKQYHISERGRIEDVLKTIFCCCNGTENNLYTQWYND